MKRFFMIMTATVLMGTTAVAQDNNGQRPQFDRTEMIKQRTDAMVEKYKLDADQAKKLLELNTKNAETMGPGMGMGRMGGGRPGGMVAVVAVVRLVRVARVLPRWVAVASR